MALDNYIPNGNIKSSPKHSQKNIGVNLERKQPFFVLYAEAEGALHIGKKIHFEINRLFFLSFLTGGEHNESAGTVSRMPVWVDM